MKVCALIPFYNNRKTVAQVIAKVSEYLPDVILVNDGSTDGSKEQVLSFPQVVCVDHPQNRGKGAAVKSGVVRARQLGFTHVIQLDADDQHNADDIPRFLAEAKSRPEAVLAGERNFGENVPGSSLFGWKFGMFWFRLETGGYPLTDTQCGFRLYPVDLFPRINVRGNRMDFDVEVLVKAVWARVPVVGIRTDVRYFPKEERVTHFRPLKDNLLFSWLHFRLTMGAAIRGAVRLPGRILSRFLPKRANPPSEAPK